MTWWAKEKPSSAMFLPQTLLLTSLQRHSQGNSTGNSSELWDYDYTWVGVSKTTTPSSSELSYWTPRWSVGDQCQSGPELNYGTPCRNSDIFIFIFVLSFSRLLIAPRSCVASYKRISTHKYCIKSYFFLLTPQSSLHLLGSDWGMSPCSFTSYCT